MEIKAQSLVALGLSREPVNLEAVTSECLGPPPEPHCHPALPEAFLGEMQIHSSSLDDMPTVSGSDTSSPRSANTRWEARILQAVP